ncbi:zinc finger CCCH domain-containing protein 3-like isoform X1 [Nicotiana tabacum]|uniref:Zinc finger CCCH domain-containing protein 3-like isoform X1 n=2 Tax=Nicotiana TaxID=4085 RepID=A0A1S4C9K5_TOBAC|nr:PREDICTED: zinc finger CCCH domain-containing protein 3 isoform X2 [Nicotiana sylvestris]XP_016497791.1 PREDICTED: zinc finger CCCH domain-containing protein 3-like isoform X2 [Nicotiana tabacum]
MPLGKYYCDYCDKEFQDTAAARKRHLQGVQHQRAKALWYDSLRNPQLYNDPDSFGKGVCNHFVRTGYCQYGDSCKYYHPKQNSQNLQQTGIPGKTTREGIHLESVSNSQLFGSASFPGDVFRENGGAKLGNLPPSLRPPPEGGYPPLPFVDWG